MRSTMLAMCVALVLLFGSMHAQGMPSRPSSALAQPSGERTVMDAVFWALPGESGLTCLQLPPGHLAITLRLEQSGELQPVRYRFAPYWYRAADTPSEIDVNVSSDARTVEATLAGGRYCYAILNGARPPVDAEVTESTGRAQLVAVRMSLTP
jgi:hypothetical protein